MWSEVVMMSLDRSIPEEEVDTDEEREEEEEEDDDPLGAPAAVDPGAQHLQQNDGNPHAHPAQVVNPADQVVPDRLNEPLMGHRGERWCNHDPRNIIEGRRRR